MPAGTSACSEESRGRGCPCEAARDPVPVSSSWAAAFTSAAARAVSCCCRHSCHCSSVTDMVRVGTSGISRQAGGPRRTALPPMQTQHSRSDLGNEGSSRAAPAAWRRGPAAASRGRARRSTERTPGERAPPPEPPWEWTPPPRGCCERRGLRAGPPGRVLPAGARGGTAAAAPTAFPAVARRSRTVDHTEIMRGVRSVGGPSTSAATGLSACRGGRRRWRRGRRRTLFR